MTANDRRLGVGGSDMAAVMGISKYRSPLQVFLEKTGVLPDFEGNRDGVYERFYDNGQLMERANYVNGERDGVYERFHDNGQLMERANYVNGQLGERSTYVNGNRLN